MEKTPTPQILFAVLGALLAAPAARAADEAPPPEWTEQHEPAPPKLRAPAGGIPSDAIALFDGGGLEHWTVEREGAPLWEVADGALVVAPGSGSLRTKRAFGDAQLHIEFRAPAEVRGEGQGRGNSGIFLMGLYEIQVLDSWENETYVNGQLGAIYKQYPPLANPARAPGEWQSYDIVFLAPRFAADGSLERPARMTAFLNGVLAQYDSELKGPTTYRGLPQYEPHPEKLPLALQDHGDRVAYRNIWIRELDGDEIADRTILEALE